RPAYGQTLVRWQARLHSAGCGLRRGGIPSRGWQARCGRRADGRSAGLRPQKTSHQPVRVAGKILVYRILELGIEPRLSMADVAHWRHALLPGVGYFRLRPRAIARIDPSRELIHPKMRQTGFVQL